MLRFPLQNGVESKETTQNIVSLLKLNTDAAKQRKRPQAQYTSNKNYVTLKHPSKAVKLKSIDVKDSKAIQSLEEDNVRV